MLLNSQLSRIGFLVFLSLLNPGLVQCVQLPAATTVPNQPVAATIASKQTVAAVPKRTVAFKLSASSGSEAVATTNLAVSLNGTNSQTVTVNYTVNNSTASNTNFGSGKDYNLARGTLTFQPGVTTKNIPISILNDSINEADETIKVTLSNPKNAILGGNSSHTYTIVDNDRKSIVDIKKDFGAVGNGTHDDTAAIQRAINTTYSRGGGVILFPPGVYIVKSVDLKENITYQGYGATIKRPPMQGRATRTFDGRYSGKADSKPLIIKGLTFDGNSKNQGAYKNHQLEQAHLIFLAGNKVNPGKLKAIVEDCTFKNGVADGISVYNNVAVKVYNCQAIDVFRGGFVLTGGYSSAEVSKLTTRGKIDPTGIDIEIDGRGYGNTLKVDVKLEELNLINGDFDIAVSEGSKVTGNKIVADAPLFLSNLNSTMNFTNSKFKVGAADTFSNRIVFPGHLTFTNCEFTITRKETGKPYSFFAAADIWWQHRIAPTQRNQLLVFNNCQFKVDSNIRSTDKTYAIHSREDVKANNNRFQINGGNISNTFKVKAFNQTVQ